MSETGSDADLTAPKSDFRSTLPRPDIADPANHVGFVPNSGHSLRAAVVASGTGCQSGRRGGTSPAEPWTSLEPGWRVLDGPNMDSIEIEYHGVRVH